MDIFYLFVKTQRTVNWTNFKNVGR